MFIKNEISKYTKCETVHIIEQMADRGTSKKNTYFMDAKKTVADGIEFDIRKEANRQQQKMKYLLANINNL